MKRQLSYLVVLLVLLISSINVVAQAPSISYSPSTNALLNGLPFSISPINAGGAVPATVYGTISTFAGSATGATGRTNATGTAARFTSPRSIAIDIAGNHYIADAGNNEIRLASSAGVVTLLAGSTAGTNGMTNASGTAALFDGPFDLTADPSGNLYIADFNNNQIRKITIATGAVTLLAGSTTGVNGTTNATGTAARFDGPAGIVYNPVDGCLYVSDFNNNIIRKVTLAGVVTTFAGSGAAGRNNATGTAATFNGPNGIGVDATGNMYIGDQGNNEIRKIIRATAAVSLFAGATNAASGTTDGTGTTARFLTPRGITVDASGNLYVTDSGNNTVRLITPGGLVSTFGGTAGTAGYVNGVGTAAQFNQPRGLDFDPATGNLYVADYNNNAIRQIITTGYYISAPLPAGLSFDNTTGIISGTPTANFGSTTYTVFAFNATGSSSTTITLSCTTPVITQWRGTTNSIWTTTSNWSNGVPTTTKSAEIGTTAYTGVKAQPTISANTTIQSIEFGTLNTPTLTINSGITLTVSNGMGVDASSTATINGPGTISLDGGSFVTAGGSVTIALNGIVQLAATAQLVNSGTFTLASDASGSASIAAIPSTSSVTGNFSVQRYITGGSAIRRGYRLLSSPVYASAVSGVNVYSINYLKNSIYLTGTSTSGGMDNTAVANPTLYLYRENLTNPSNATFIGGNFRGINNINSAPTYGMDDASYATTNIPVGNGYLCFFRGSRATSFASKTTAPYPTPENTTLTATGTLNQGTIVVKDWFTASGLSYTSGSPAGIQGFNLVGNPYPSSIDWEQFGTGITGTNITSTMYILDPVSKNYRSYAKGSGGIGSDGSTSANIIPTGQGFFVLASTTNPTLTFTEAAKTASQQPNLTLYQGMPADLVTNKQYLLLQLAKDQVNTDGILINFNNNIKNRQYDNNVDALYKQGYGAVSLSSRSADNIDLSINTMALPGKSETIGLTVNATVDTIYQLTLKNINGIPKLYDVWLMDAYKKDSMDMRQNKTYSFNIYKKDTASFGANRFSLVIRQNPAYTYHLLDFTANKLPSARQVQIVWKTENEENYTHFTVERSVDNGKIFDVLGSAKAAGQGTYSLLDKTPVLGQNLYRLKQEDINNTISYSKPVVVLYANLSNQAIANNLSIYPNPVINTVSLDILSKITENSSYRIRFMNSSGTVVKQVVSSQPSWQGSISGLQPGIYLIRVVNGKNDAFVGETKFVKL